MSEIVVRIKILDQNPIDLGAVTLTIHPDFQWRNLKSNLAVITTGVEIPLNSGDVGAACLPHCVGMFNYQFANGTGTRYSKLNSKRYSMHAD